MTRWCLGLLLAAWLPSPLAAAERTFDFGMAATTAPPEGWRPLLAGEGPPGDWRLVLDDVPGAPEQLAPGAARRLQRTVLAQVSTDPTDERFPLLAWEGDRFRDFTLRLRFKTVAGTAERMAGVAFRLQDERNFYVVRASTLGNSFRFYRVQDGVRSPPIGPSLPLASGEWHELVVTAAGNRFRFQLNGQEPIPELTDNTFGEGRLALWTKSDSVTYFADLHLAYTPLEPLAQELVRETLLRYPRLRDLRLYAPTRARPELHVVAAKDPKDLGRAATTTEQEVVARNQPYAGKTRQSYLVTLPLHDLNGDPIAAVRVELDTFLGQTEANALSRAQTVVRHLSRRVTTLAELTQ